MKTRLMITLLAVFTLLLSAGFASAAATAISAAEQTDLNVAGTAAGNGGAVNVTTSKNVVGAYNASNTSYALGMFHSNGTREYGTGSQVGGIFYQGCALDPCGTETIGADDNSAEDFTDTAWTKL